MSNRLCRLFFPVSSLRHTLNHSRALICITDFVPWGHSIFTIHTWCKMVWSRLSITFYHSKIFETSALHHIRLWQVDWISQALRFGVLVILHSYIKGLRHLECRTSLSKWFNQTYPKRATPWESLRSNCNSYLMIAV